MLYIFISASQADLGFVQVVRNRLQHAGRATWSDDGTHLTVAQDRRRFLEDVIQYASVVVALNGGVTDEIEVANLFGKPVVYFNSGEDIAGLFAELDRLISSVPANEITPLPKPLAGDELEELSRAYGSRFSMPSLATVAVIIIVIMILSALFLIIQTQNGDDGSAQYVDAPAFTPELLPSETLAPASPSDTPQVISAGLGLAQATATDTTVPTMTLTPIETETQTALPTPLPTELRTLTWTPTSTIVPTFTATPSPTMTFTLSPTFTPTASATIPALGATLIPDGMDNALWIPIERLINGLAMVYVPGGCFMMSTADDATPEVLCVEPYWISKTETTNAQYHACVDAGVCTDPAVTSSRTRQDYYGNSRYGDYPVINITWRQAQEFSSWFGGSLPSEIQWRYAAQGPSDMTYPWGNAVPNAALLNYDDTLGDVSEVGAYPKGASWVGALDLAGNVWEWTNTTIHEPNKVICGGSWNSYGGLVGAAALAENPEADGNVYTGFRLILDVASTP